MSCAGPWAMNPLCLVGAVASSATSSVADSAFARISGWFGLAAQSAATWLWRELDNATSLDLSSPTLRTQLAATGAIAAVLCLGLFLIQVITAALRREPGGLARAVMGLFVSFIASAVALGATQALLAAVDALSAGLVAYTMHTNMTGLGTKMAVGELATNQNPAVSLLLSTVVIAAVVIVWAAMMLRKVMLLIAAVLAPLAFAGATADITRGWVRKWVEFVAAMVVSKLLLVIILGIGLAMVNGAGQSGSGVTQTGTQLAGGALVLLLGGLSPWIAIRMFHFAGDTLYAAHATTGHATTGARTVIAAPQKVAAISGQVRTISSLASAPSRALRAPNSGVGLRQGQDPDGAPRPTPPTGGGSRDRWTAGACWAGCGRGTNGGRGSRVKWRRRSRRHPGCSGHRGRCGRPGRNRRGPRRCRRGNVGCRIGGRGRASRAARAPAATVTQPQEAFMTDTTGRTPTVRFAGLPRRGLLLGLSGIRVACLAIAGAVVVTALLRGGGRGFFASGPVWVGLVGLALARWHGRPAAETLPTAAHYLTRRALGQTRYRARIERPRPAGTLFLPGDAAALRFHLDQLTGAAMVHDPHAHTLSVVGHITHPAYVLLPADEQARRVHGWGRALATLAATGTGTRIQVLETTLPDAGHGITGWWATQGVHDGGWAATQYEHLMTTVVPAAATHRTLVAVSLDLRRARTQVRHAGHGLPGAAVMLRQEMTALEVGLRAADLTLSRWLDEPALAAVLRTAYDPAHDAAACEADGVPGRLGTAGPVAVDEHWDHLQHDTGHSAVLWVSQWPRTEAPTYFLHALVFQPGIRKTISITLEPLPLEQAMRDIRKAKVEYVTDATQKARIGAIADLADAQEHHDVLDRERALLAGHADVRFTGLLAVTATGRDELEVAVAQIARAAIQAGCETRRLHGRQARAFAAAALPLARKVT